MYHHYIHQNVPGYHDEFPYAADSSHYAVSCNDYCILIQLGDSIGQQVRLSLNEEQAAHIVKLLEQNIAKYLSRKKENKQ